MDPIAHTFTGAALAAAGLRKVAPAATAALLIGANVPDIDVLAGFAGDFRALELRRGWTHGVLAVMLWPFVVTALLLLWERWRREHDPPSDPRRLLSVAALAVATHPTLDWLNNYGLRWLMPFDGRWFYGDALFIIDPWLWLWLGGALCLRHSHRPVAIACWTAFWLGATLLVFANAEARAASIVWMIGLCGLLGLRVSLTRYPHAALDRAAQTALAVAAVYIAACALSTPLARSQAREALNRTSVGQIEDLMVAPTPADPFAGFVIAATSDRYYLADWHWLAEPRLRLRAETIPIRLDEPAAQAAMRTELARRFLVWSRYPYADVTPRTDGGYTVALRDARYDGNARLFGPVVQLDANLEPLIGDNP